MKRLKVLGILLITVMLAVGCGSKESSDPTEPAAKGNEAVAGEEDPDDESENEDDADDSQDPQDNENTDLSSEDEDAEVQTNEETRTVKIYYIDDETGEQISKDAEIENEDDIWAQLQQTGIITEECDLLGFEFNDADGTIDLDFNKALGDRIRSMGTAGETEILSCLVNTYLDAYGCSGIRLTEEGQAFETGHGADYDGYTGRIEF